MTDHGEDRQKITTEQALLQLAACLPARQLNQAEEARFLLLLEAYVLSGGAAPAQCPEDIIF